MRTERGGKSQRDGNIRPTVHGTADGINALEARGVSAVVYKLPQRQILLAVEAELKFGAAVALAVSQRQAPVFRAGATDRA